MGKGEVNSGGISTGQALLIAFLALTPEPGGVHFGLSNPPPFLSDSFGSQAPFSGRSPQRERRRERRGDCH